MSKFKVGDKVRCIACSTREHILNLGNIYEVAAITEDNFVHLQGVQVHHKLSVGRFELVEPNPVLTPEEVFEHLREGVKLQWRYKGKDHWQDCINAGNVQVRCILDSDWRIKPEPEIIELNGKKYREIIE